MIMIKTKEGGSLLIALVAALVVAAVGIALKAAWLYVLMLALGTFGIVMFSALFIIRKYVAYKAEADLFDRPLARRRTRPKSSMSSRTSVWRTSARS